MHLQNQLSNFELSLNIGREAQNYIDHCNGCFTIHDLNYLLNLDEEYHKSRFSEIKGNIQRNVNFFEELGLQIIKPETNYNSAYKRTYHKEAPTLYILNIEIIFLFLFSFVNCYNINRLIKTHGDTLLNALR